jgi:hypothetical protein
LGKKVAWVLSLVLIAWAVAVTYVPGVAVMVYGDEGAIMSSAIAASAGSGLIALAVVWTAHLVTRATPGDREPA